MHGFRHSALVHGLTEFCVNAWSHRIVHRHMNHSILHQTHGNPAFCINACNRSNLHRCIRLVNAAFLGESCGVQTAQTMLTQIVVLAVK